MSLTGNSWMFALGHAGRFILESALNLLGVLAIVALT
jgi:hypothetical protein